MDILGCGEHEHRDIHNYRVSFFMASKSTVFWPIAAFVFLADFITKRLAVEYLAPHVPREVIGSFGCLTLTYNKGMALGIDFGAWSRSILIITALILLGGLLWLYHRVEPNDRPYAACLGMILGGAVGNLLDRLMSTRGVVDFIDIGVGSIRFWTFNVADIGVTIGTLILALIVWRREKQLEGN
jgi:signal peptidase II